jgi:N utilization substance protein B
MEESPRRRARELVLKRLYAAEVEEIDQDEIIKRIVDEDSLSERNLEFARQFFLLVRQHRIWADRIIAQLAEHWDVERIALIDRLLLRMALVELHEMPDTPVKVAINEAIELAKKYSTGESSSFINGILDRYAKNMGAYEGIQGGAAGSEGRAE